MQYVVKQVDINRPNVKKLLIELQKECLPMDKALKPTYGYWWIVYHAGIAVGFAALNASFRWEKTGYLMRAGIILDHQGRGLQRRLIRIRERKARQLGWQYMISDTHYNPPSANNLIKCGYKIYDPSKPWAFKASNYWIKKL
jgi:GNAT superfamily N-acetyltransferase